MPINSTSAQPSARPAVPRSRWAVRACDRITWEPVPQPAPEPEAEYVVASPAAETDGPEAEMEAGQ